MGIAHIERPYVSRRHFLRSAGVVAAASTAGPLLWEQPSYAAAAPVRHLHLTYGHNAAREMRVGWMTPTPVRRPFVQIAGSRIPAATKQYRGYPGYFHTVHLEDLEPAETYRYRVGHAGEVRKEAKLSTGPRGRAEFTFTAFGDQGHSDGTRSGNDARANTELARRFDPALHVIVGDLAYANGNQSIWDQWFAMISPMARRRPWMPTLGNHEIETQLDPFGHVRDSWGPMGYDPYRTRFALPGNKVDGLRGCFYRFRYGSVEFVAIDNNDVTAEIRTNRGYSGGRQQEWVQRTLKRAAADPDVDFIVVLMHQCAFSSSPKHGSDSGVRRAWFDLFAKYEVDLVLQGHDHTYERTHAMRGTTVVDRGERYRTDAGTVYVVCGNGGAKQEPFEPGRPKWSAFRRARTVGTLRIDVDPFAPNKTARMTLGEYAAADGRPIEEGIILERPHRHPRTTGTTRDGDGVRATGAMAVPEAGGGNEWIEALPSLDGLAGVAAVTAAAAGAAAVGKVTLGRLRDPGGSVD